MEHKTTPNTGQEQFIESYTFDELEVGQSATLIRKLREQDIEYFAAISDDVDPRHLERQLVQAPLVNKSVAHGLWAGALVSSVLGTRLPGPGTFYTHLDFDFEQPLPLGETLTLTVRVVEKMDNGRVRMACICANDRGELLLRGHAEVIPPKEKLRHRVQVHQVTAPSRDWHLSDLIDSAKSLDPLATAVVHPVDEASLLGAVRATEAGLILPLLVGPESRIRAAAERIQVDLKDYRIIDTAHSHEAASRAVELVRCGDANALLKGKLHTGELMAAVLKAEVGLRTERRLSHVFIMDVPGYDRPLLVTDAAINIAPSLDTKADILKNVIDLAHALGIEVPRVAILCAVETVCSSMPCTLEASALCKMVDRGQITGALVDGPLAFDNAVDIKAARIKGIQSEVAGRVDVLVAPDLEAGNILAKQFEYVAGAAVAGVVMGARVPIALTSRADNELARMSSCAIASLVHAARLKGLLS